MKIVALRADMSGCGFYRIEEPARVLRERGHDVVIQEWLDVGYDRNDKIVEVPFDADVLILQRPVLPSLVEASQVLKRRGVKIVVELDDDLERIPAHHPAHRIYDPAVDPERNTNHLRGVCRVADRIIVSTPSLLRRYAPNGNGVVVENRVPEWLIEIKHTGGRGVGWPGTIASHRGDLTVVRHGLADESITVIGDPKDVAEEIGHDPWRVTGTGWLDLPDYLKALTTLDVGLAPLAENSFNNAKSWLKPLELAAAGVPSVVSPSPEYQRLADLIGDDVVRIAKKPRVWARECARLRENDWALARELSPLARERVLKAGLTNDAGADTWEAAWTAF